MKVYYDAQVDALYIELQSLSPGTAENREISEGAIANYAPDGKLAGLEILNASFLLKDEPSKIILEITPSIGYATHGLEI